MPLTSQGLTIKRLTQLKQEFDQRLTETFGPINTEPDSVIGQLGGIWAEAAADLYEQLQDTYHAMYPFSAEGSSLDGAVAYTGIIRFKAVATQVNACVYGRESTLLSQNALATDGTHRYIAASDIIISRTNAIDVCIEVSLKQQHTYQININGDIISYQSDDAPDITNIIDQLGQALDTKKLGYHKQQSGLRIFATNGTTPFSISVGNHLTINRIGSPVVFVAEETGRKVLPIGALNQIISPRSGWDSINNLVTGKTGRDRESDEELRQRFEQTRQMVGSATNNAIRSRLLQEVIGIHAVYLFENRSSILSEDGIPPHAFETLVEGGDDQQIAQCLWRYKPAGIETQGEIEVIVTDENQDGQLVRFSRPKQVYAWIRVQVNELYDEEILPSNIINSIKQTVLQQGNLLKINEDIILQRFLGPIYANTSGLGQLTLSAAVTRQATDKPDYQQHNILIDRRTTAIFDLTRIEVAGL